jgi:hypothetical protein
MRTGYVRALEQDFGRSSKKRGALLYTIFFGSIHTYTTERPTKSFRTLMGARAIIWAIEQDFGHSNVRKYSRKQDGLCKRTPHKNENAKHGRTHEVLGFLAKLWALKCGNMFSQDLVFGQAVAHKSVVKFEGALEQMYGRALICVGARVMYRCYIRLLFCRARN